MFIHSTPAITMKAALSLLVSVASVSPALGASYNLIKTLSGNTFFDDWNYINDWDHFTNGDIQYLPRSSAGNLTSVNAAGNAVIRMDDFTGLGDNVKRNSIRLESTHILNNTNAVLVYDVAHVPYGCSVWGSLWTKGAINAWPKGGEVDIFEAVNKMTNNQYALHTKSACTIAQSNSGQTGTVVGSAVDCQIYVNADGTYGNPSGCEISDPSANSYSNFADSNGGVWIAEFATTGVSIWFISRSAVPSSLASAQSIDTSTLGNPTASFPNGASCDITQALEPQQMVIDITACGDWAGANATIEATCGPLTVNSCYNQYVHNASNYHDAYFEIASIKVFGDDSTFVQNGTTTTGGGNSGTATGTGASSTSTHNAASALVTSYAPWSILMLGLSILFTL